MGHRLKSLMSKINIKNILSPDSSNSWFNSCFFFQAGYVTSYNYFPVGARALDFGATDAEKPGSNRSRLNKMMIKITPSSRFRAGTWSANAERCHEQYLAPTPRCSASVLAEHLRIYQSVELNGVQSVFFKLPSGGFFPQKSFPNCFTLSAFIRFISLCKIAQLLCFLLVPLFERRIVFNISCICSTSVFV